MKAARRQATDKPVRDGVVLRLRQALEVARSIDEQMTVSHARTFLTVAAYEGRSLRQYAELLNLPQSTMSRHLLDLGIMYRDRSPGLGLIDQRQNPDDLRSNVYCLSDRGKQVVEELEAIFRPRRRK